MKKFNLGNNIYIGLMVLCIMITTFVCINSSIQKNKFIEEYSLKLEESNKRIEALEKECASLKADLDKCKSDIKDISNLNSGKMNPAIKDRLLKSINVNGVSLYQYLKTIEQSKPKATVNTKDVTKKSNLTVEQFDAVINKIVVDKYKKTNSKLIGNGKYLKHVEDTYGINGLFVLSIASLESGYGTVGPKNNLFGLTKSGGGYASFESLQSSYDTFGRNLKKGYIDKGLTTIPTIAKKYCPPNKNKWTKDVSWFMKLYSNALAT